MHRSACCAYFVAATALLLTTGCDRASSAEPTATARLRLTQEQTDCCYDEGQVSFATISGMWGRKVAHREFAQLGDAFPVFDMELEPGKYRVVSYQRPCNGNCGFLDPPTDRCASSIDVKPGETWFLTISFAPMRGCTITRTVTAPSPSVSDRFALRETYPDCGEDMSGSLPADTDPRILRDLGGDNRACFVQANAEGRIAELSAYERSDDSDVVDYVVYRTNADRSVDVFRPDEMGDTTNTRWSWMRCAGLTPTGADGFELTGCAEPQIE